MGPVTPDEERDVHRRLYNQGKAIRYAAIGIILLSLGLICSNIGNIIQAFGRIF